MLRKRNRSHQKHQMLPGSDSYPRQSDFPRQNNHRNGSFFSIPGLFVGLSNKGLSDYDSAWSPTSPLDFRVFSSFGNPFASSPRSTQNGHQKGWGSGKVGLSIVDSLDDDTKPSGKVMRSSDSKNILFGPGIRIRNPKCQNNIETAHELKPVPTERPVFLQPFGKSPMLKDDKPGVVFEIGDSPTETVELEEPGNVRSCSLDSYGKFPACLGSSDHRTSLSLGEICLNNTVPPLTSPSTHVVACPPNLNGFPLKRGSGSLASSNGGFVESLSASGVELSEDYTCVISHGPNPKTTHFFGDRVLEFLDNNILSNSFSNKDEKEIVNVPLTVAKPANVYPSDNFLSFCCSCHKKLEEGKDIYIYRGEKGFCSTECRSREILVDEEMQQEVAECPPKNSQEPYGPAGIVFTT